MVDMDDVIALCKRRGFLYPSSDIYGGLANSWDFGHYGTLLKNNIRDLWWNVFVLKRDDMVGLDASIFLNPEVWKASGHVDGFTDALVDCRNCHFRTRADHLIEDKLKDVKVEGLSPEKLTGIIRENHLKCPKCGKEDLTDVRKFNLLFETKMGIIEDAKSTLYLRGEIAQGIFLNFKNVLNSLRVKLPFGIAQQGKAFRNEITLGRSVFRTMEFDLMEFEYFIHPSIWEATMEMWKNEMWKFALSLGLQQEKLRWREHEDHERSHYSKKTMDIEYQFSFGWKEMFGLAYRTDFDLKNHMENSGKDLRYLDQKTNERFIPHVIEPTFGLSRLTGIILEDAYRVEEVNGQSRTYLKLDPKIAPIKAAVFPLQKDEKLGGPASALYRELKNKMTCEYDNAGNIGKMYRRQDEIGTPFCVTVDFESIEDKKATVRFRDTMEQQRIDINKIPQFIGEHLSI
jgi:glycyl-tRNA synthetase